MAYNGIEKIDVKGKDILIIGAGAIGLLGAACAKAIGEYLLTFNIHEEVCTYHIFCQGATQVIVADVLEKRLELAKKMGADITIDCSKKDLMTEIMAITGGVGVSRLMEASGHHVMVNNSFKMMRKAQIKFPDTKSMTTKRFIILGI